MSAPYPQQPNHDAGRRSFELKEILVLASVGAGLVGYLLGFFDDSTAALMGSMAGFGLICSAVLAGLRFLPRTPNALFAAVPLSAYTALVLLQDVVRNTGTGLVPVLLVLGLAQLAAVVGVLLIEGGKFTPGTKSAPPKQQAFPQQGPRPTGPAAPPRPGQGWNPQNPPAQGQPPQGQPPFAGPPPWAPSGNPQQRNPSSDGFAVPNPDSSGPHKSTPQSQTSPPATGEPDHGGPQGTRHMPHPGTTPPTF